jgi:tetratricopeptide (TPR) repeat protein
VTWIMQHKDNAVMPASNGEQPTHASSSATAECATAKRGKPTGWRKWVYRLLAMTLAPTLLFVILEGSLRLGGYGYSTSFFLDGTKVEGQEVWIENFRFDHWFFPPGLQATTRAIPFAISRRKLPRRYRIFVLGESAAQGFPDFTTNFARILEVMLRAHYPSARIEVVNTAMIAVNSHVVRAVAQQCADHEPDLFIVHLGNNEVVGPFGAAGVIGSFGARLGIIRANLAVKTTRTGQLLNRLVRKLTQGQQSPRAWIGMATFADSHVRADDERLKQIEAHFRENLRDVCRAGTDAHAPVLVCTIPVNLKDSAPFGSAHADGLTSGQVELWDKAYQEGVSLEAAKSYTGAIRCYQSAAAIDDTFADLAFRLGRCYAALGKTTQARQQFERARDLDTLRFRTDTNINAAIRDVVAACAEDGVHLVDAERAFERSSPDGIPGEDHFYEHVHMNFHGNYVLARTVFENIRELAPAELGPPRSETAAPLSEEQCAEQLGYTDWQAYKNAEQVNLMISQRKPFTAQLDHHERARRWLTKLKAMRASLESGGMEKAIAVARKAARSAEDDWITLWAAGNLLSENGNMQEAEQLYVAAAARLRHNHVVRVQLGNHLLKTGRIDEAIGHFKDAIRFAPEYMEAHFGLAKAYSLQGKNAEARAIYEERLRKGPNRFLALTELVVFLSQTGKLKEAEERTREVLKMVPDDIEVLGFLGDLEMKQHRVTEAIEHYEAAMRIWPDWPGLREKLEEARKESDLREKKRTHPATQ